MHTWIGTSLARTFLSVGLLSMGALSIGALSSGCYLTHTRGGEPEPSTPECPEGYSCRPVAIRATDAVDLLFLIDNSGSMVDEQASLVREFPRMVRILMTGDRDEDGTTDFTPVGSLHVGVVTTDMGGGPYSGIPTCPMGFGDDGILRRASGGSGRCTPSTSGIFEFRSGMDDPAAFAERIGCIATVGTNGCGFEQQLEAPLKALTPESPAGWTRPGYVPPRFASLDGSPMGIPGNGDHPDNTGFLRPYSVLAIVIVSDEEDCSVSDYGIFVPTDPRYASIPLNLRCNSPEGQGAVRPIERYVDGFLGLRREPSRLVFAAIVGIPLDTEASAARGDYAAVLAHPAMVPLPDPTGLRLSPSCTFGDSAASPPVRIVEVAEGLAAEGAVVSLSSICNPTFQPAIDRLVDRLAVTLYGACLPEPLTRRPDGLVDCVLYETLPAGLRCSSFPGRIFDHAAHDASGVAAEVCSIDQQTDSPSGAVGWYYDDSSDTLREMCGLGTRRVALTDATPLPVPGATTELRCVL